MHFSPLLRHKIANGVELLIFSEIITNVTYAMAQTKTKEIYEIDHLNLHDPTIYGII